MKNFIQLNDWDIRSFLITVSSIILATIGFNALDLINIQVPILRQLVCHICLCYLPGIMLLRILKLHKLGNTKTFLYSIGLSLSSVMFIGFFINTIYPFIGINNPISAFPLVVTFSILFLVLCALCYISDRGYSNPEYLKIKDFICLPHLTLFIILLVAIFGAYLVNFYNINLLVKLLLILISIIFLLVGFNKFYLKNSYPLVIIIVAVSLLYHMSLISMALWGTDIQNEFYYSNAVVLTGLWNYSEYGLLNSLLSIVALPPILSIISNVNLVWIFKVTYPFLFSLVPLGLYEIIKEQTNDRIAILSCFFYMSVYMFYSTMLELARQQIAELFFILLILIFIDSRIGKVHKSFMFTVFSFSLVTSHYSISYIWMFSLILSWIIFTANHRIQIHKKANSDGLSQESSGLLGRNYNKIFERDTLNINNVILFASLTLSWYIYTSSSTSFESFIQVCKNFTSVAIMDLLSSSDVEGLNIISRDMPLLHDINKFLHLMTQLFISLGLFISAFNYKKYKLNSYYMLFSSIFYGICIISLIVPNTSINLGTSRTYFICLTFLALFCTIGFTYLINHLLNLINIILLQRDKNFEKDEYSLRAFSIFLILFLLFNSGFIYEIAHDKCPTSIALNSSINQFQFNECEIKCASWLGNEVQSNIYAGDTGRFIIYNFIKHTQVQIFNDNSSNIPPNSYIFLDSSNLKKDRITVSFKKGSGITREQKQFSVSPFYNNVVLLSDKIYGNGKSDILLIGLTRLKHF